MSAHGKPFTVFKRKNSRIYYAQFKLPSGQWSAAKSTGETSKGSAERWAIEYLSAGQIVVKETVTLAEFSKDFFSWEAPWATNKRVTGKRISRHHCQDCAGLLENHILPRLGKMKLTHINETVIERLRNDIYSNGYSGNTTNRVLQVLKAILKAAKKQSLIQFIPEVEPAANKPKQKGILTIEEVRRIFSIEWKTQAIHCHPSKETFMGYAGNVLAASTGLRMGELQALTLSDVHLNESYLYVWRSWDKMYGLNETTKTGRARNIFIPDTVKAVLSQLIKLNPEPGNSESFLFFSEKTPGKPAEPAIFTRSLYTAMRSIGITEEQRRARNITFHSWRHWFNSLLINARVPLQKIQSLTGHLTADMSQHYYHLDDMADVRQVQESIFSPESNKPGGDVH